MPVAWELRDRVLTVTVIRDWSGGTPDTAIMAAIADPRFRPDTELLFDVRRSEMNPSGIQIRQSAEWMASLVARGLGRRFAMVVGHRPHQFGLARMAATYLEIKGIELRIFHDPDDALRWLSSPSASAASG